MPSSRTEAVAKSVATAGGGAAPVAGTVTRAEGSLFWVSLEGTGEEVPCTLRGRLKKKQLRVSTLIVVGDEVLVDLLPDGKAVIEECRPRRTEFVRPGFRGLPHVVAANLDQLVVVLATHQPDFKRRLAERYLATAARSGMEGVVVVNKCDLEDARVIEAWVEPLLASGADVFQTSALTGKGIGALRDRLTGRASVLAGQSGVGKSSLVNAMFPEWAIRTQAVSWANKGRHTTTSSRLYPLPGGGYLADTPGVRELGLFEDSEDDVDEVFPEITALAPLCKFRDCTHTHEPRCAVKAAVEAGEIDEDRYANYVRLRKRL